MTITTTITVYLYIYIRIIQVEPGKPGGRSFKREKNPKPKKQFAFRMSGKVTLQHHQMLRLPRKVTLELHQVLRLPRKVNLSLLHGTVIWLLWTLCINTIYYHVKNSNIRNNTLSAVFLNSERIFTKSLLWCFHLSVPCHLAPALPPLVRPSSSRMFWTPTTRAFASFIRQLAHTSLREKESLHCIFLSRGSCQAVCHMPYSQKRSAHRHSAAHSSIRYPPLCIDPPLCIAHSSKRTARCWKLPGRPKGLRTKPSTATSLAQGNERYGSSSVPHWSQHHSQSMWQGVESSEEFIHMRRSQQQTHSIKHQDFFGATTNCIRCGCSLSTMFCHSLNKLAFRCSTPNEAIRWVAPIDKSLTLSSASDLHRSFQGNVTSSGTHWCTKAVKMKDDSDTTLQCFSIHVTFKCFICMFTGSRNISAIQFHGFIFVDTYWPNIAKCLCWFEPRKADLTVVLPTFLRTQEKKTKSLMETKFNKRPSLSLRFYKVLSCTTKYYSSTTKYYSALLFSNY